jgi:subtilisin family serine protease
VRRFALVAATVLAVTLGTGQPALASADLAPAAPSGRFAPLDLGGVGRIANLPRSLRRDATVNALVELTGAPVAAAADKPAARARVQASQEAAMPRLRAAGATVQGRLGTVLNAVRVRATVRELDRIASMSGVKSVQVSRTVTVDNAAADRFTGTDRAWAELGFTGTGVTVGVIDTGIDYTHADFGGAGTAAAFTSNNGAVIEPGSFPTPKVVAGYDFVGDGYDSSSTDPAKAVPHPDPDPLDCEGHGTHVAGTAAGQGVTAAGAPFTGRYDRSTLDAAFDVAPGSAPQATLAAYRVFGCDGSAGDEVVIAAIDRAVADGIDVINMSLGSTFGTANDLETAAIDNATTAGVLVVASAGNEGPGAYTTGSPASADSALSVAAVDAEFAAFPGVRISGAVTGSAIVANQAPVPAPITGALLDVGLGCDAADYAGAAGKVVVSTRGTCDRVARAGFGQQAGALAVIMINTDPGYPPFEGEIPGVTIPFLGVTPQTGAVLKAAAGQQVTLTAGPDITNPGYTRAADFSSGGPRRLDDAQKPDVAAPGVSMLSAAVGTGTGGIRESGTSMASPHTAGVAALVAQAHPTWPPLRIKSAIMSTAAPEKVGGYDSRRVGTGLVQPRRAAAATAWISAASGRNSLRFGMRELAGGFSSTRSFTIDNGGSAAVTYDLSTRATSPGLGADRILSARSMRVPAHGSRSVSLTIRYTAADVARLPGAAASDLGALTSLHGFVRATPRTPRGGVFTLRMAFVSVPVGLSDVRPTSLQLSGDATTRSGTLSVRNRGRHAGTAELYGWLLSDPAGDAADPEVPDLVDLGVASLPGTVVDEPAANRLIVFLANTAAGTSTQSSHEVDVTIDTDRDGTADFVVFTADLGLVTTGSASGSMGSFVVDLDAPDEVVAAYNASAPANGSTIAFPVLAGDLGLTASSGPISVTADGFATVGEEELPGDGTSTARVDPFHMVVTTGRSATVAPGATARFRVNGHPSRRPAQSTRGWLVQTQDDRAGLAEANRVRLP